MCCDQISFDVKVGEQSSRVHKDLIKACYDERADRLVVGAHGLSHSIREGLRNVKERITGTIPEYCMRHAPCDVFIVRHPHEYE